MKEAARTWRATMVQWKDSPCKSALLLSFHHLITDGMGALQFARAIILNDAVSESGDIDAALSKELSHQALLPKPVLDAVIQTVKLANTSSLSSVINHVVFVCFNHLSCQSDRRFAFALNNYS